MFGYADLADGCGKTAVDLNRRKLRVCLVTVAELTRSARAPGVYAAVLGKRRGELRACRYRYELNLILAVLYAYKTRCCALCGCCRICAKLTLIVKAPGVNSAAACKSYNVVSAYRDFLNLILVKTAYCS